MFPQRELDTVLNQFKLEKTCSNAAIAKCILIAINMFACFSFTEFSFLNSIWKPDKQVIWHYRANSKVIFSSFCDTYLTFETVLR